jgi:hypothetical protein
MLISFRLPFQGWAETAADGDLPAIFAGCGECEEGRKWCRRSELNTRPHPYQICGLMDMKVNGGKRLDVNTLIYKMDI